LRAPAYVHITMFARPPPNRLPPIAATLDAKSASGRYGKVAPLAPLPPQGNQGPDNASHDEADAAQSLPVEPPPSNSDQQGSCSTAALDPPSTSTPAGAGSDRGEGGGKSEGEGDGGGKSEGEGDGGGKSEGEGDGGGECEGGGESGGAGEGESEVEGESGGEGGVEGGGAGKVKGSIRDAWKKNVEMQTFESFRTHSGNRGLALVAPDGVSTQPLSAFECANSDDLSQSDLFRGYLKWMATAAVPVPVLAVCMGLGFSVKGGLAHTISFTAVSIRRYSSTLPLPPTLTLTLP